ncbi:MAG: hypothetical protein IJ557_02470 [Bacteroidaceae bacterium]|nr:hypothetical protein [Bacteroidaceae bacterium]
MDVREIKFNIYASSDEEAQRGRMAIIQFINTIGQYGAKVSGHKIAEAVGKMNSNRFIMQQIINFFK